MAKSEIYPVHRKWLCAESFFAASCIAAWPIYWLAAGRPFASDGELGVQVVILGFLIEHVRASFLAFTGNQHLHFGTTTFEVRRGGQAIVSIPYEAMAKAGGKSRLWFGNESGPPERVGILLKGNASGVRIKERSPLYSLNPFRRWSYVTRFEYSEPTDTLLQQLKRRGVPLR